MLTALMLALKSTNVRDQTQILLRPYSYPKRQTGHICFIIKPFHPYQRICLPDSEIPLSPSGRSYILSALRFLGYAKGATFFLIDT